jgi:GH43 family beta-xylosidase
MANSSESLHNPIVLQRADPWVYKHTDGYYYFIATVPEYDRIELRRAVTIQELGTAPAVTFWRKRDAGPMSANIWAPEIHYVQGKWYIYFAAAREAEPNESGLYDHRMYVLENEAENPLLGEWREKGQIKTKWESFSLDATTFMHNGVQYLVWAQKDPAIEGNSNLYISEMSNPWTLRGEQVCLTTPEYDWERIGYLVNEGPAVVKKNGMIFISYSASATDHHYCMGLLRAAENSDLLDPLSWVKSPKPVFESCEETGQYGPGHNCFTVSPDGQVDILVYHARSYKEIDGDPLHDPNRHTRAQSFAWNADGTPDFGQPVRDAAKDTIY